ncbi:trypsin-like serine peptidase [Rhodococcus aetherivorans]|uniref:trypsin-like serine peptidase n=1 Tax=Rhodococcus aetherivorans TaxID=191292 RepID=UPI0036725860
MNGDEFSPQGGTTVQGLPPRGAMGPNGGGDEDIRSGVATALPYRISTGTGPSEVGEFTSEVAGDPPTGGEVGAEAQEDQEVSSESQAAGEFVEATAAELGAESGEESAVSDLKDIEGFVETTSTGTESEVTETGLREVGEELAGQAEILPILASLIPTLVSTAGPAIARGITSVLSPRARATIKRLPPPPRPGAPRPPAGNVGAVLAQIAQLLRTLPQRASGESMEATDQAVVSEAAAVLEVILGKDDRVRIQNTTDVPWRRICALRITFRTGAIYRGTGFFIGPRTLATAGHCVYLHGQGGWATKIEVSPGANGSARPYGSVETSQFRSVGGWVNGKRPEYDYGCIVLPTGAFGGRNLGQFSVGVLSPQALLAKPAVLAGYPGDKPFAEMWGMARKIKTVSPTTLTYDIDTMGGQSGAPVYIKRNGVRTVVGIHNYGALTGNSATRVTSEVYRRLAAWSKL